MTAAQNRVQAIRTAVLKWYRENRRDLPWRGTKDPYAIWISEIMLQQTRVDTVRPYYERFMARWPDVGALAAANPDDVRAAWSGLGYYRRAQMMLNAAGVLTETLDGRFPTEASELKKLPGFGRYTAGAVASIAFDRPAAAVDGNVSRVLSRVQEIEGDVTKGEAAKAVWATAEALAPGESPGDLTQALIELGALVCATKSPKCVQCPLQTNCRAFASDRVDEIPPPRKRPEKKSVALTALVAVKEGAVLLARQPDKGLFAQLWCPPFLEGHLEPDTAPDEALRALKLEIAVGTSAGLIRHVLTHRNLDIQVLRIPAPAEVLDLQWAPLPDLEAWAIPTVTAKCLQAGLTGTERAQTQLTRRARKPSKQGELPI
jgi:A/G-specific adenine glycosylase